MHSPEDAAAQTKNGVLDVSNSPGSLSYDRERKLWRKVDLRLMPIITFMYLFSFMDRGNIGNAKLEGLMTQLHLTGERFNVALTAFFISYVLFECPANLVLQAVPPSRWLSGIMLAWGFIMMLMGFVKTYPQLVAVRFCLGVAEAGFFPGIAFYLSGWYPKFMVVYRVAFFIGAAAIAGAFSGLLSFGIAFMNNDGGLQGWSWIFIIEGLITIVLSGLGALVLPNYPSTANFLTAQEKQFIAIERARHMKDVEEGTVYERILAAFCNWRTWPLAFILMSLMTPGYGVTFFLPSILENFGYSVPISQLLTVPVYVIATISTVVTAHFSDRMKLRSPFIVGMQIVGLAGFTIQLSGATSGVKYFGLYLCVAGQFTAVPCAVGWLMNNLDGKYERAIGLALQASMGNIGGIIASNIFQAKDEPRYTLGLAVCTGMMGAGLMTTIATAYCYRRLNAATLALSTDVDKAVIDQSRSSLSGLYVI